MDSRLAVALEVAYQAGRSTLGYFKNGAEVEIKSDDSPVTIADKEAENLVRKLIRAKFPKEAILGEEEGLEGTGSVRWVVDPIDGTKSFVAGVPLYATLLSCEIDEKPVIGVCYLPALEEMYYASVGEGAFCNGRPIHVSSHGQIEGSTTLCGGHRTLINQKRMDGFLGLAERARVTRTWGDAFGHILVASGRAEAMIDPKVNRWDISSVSLIVREAGGSWTDFAGNPNLANEAISSNGLVHQEVLNAFAGTASH